MTKLEAFLNNLKEFKHEACKSCPWAKPGMAFGKSCQDHCHNWARSDHADVMSILQDPGGTTPEHTEKLCAVCNSANPSDKTARYCFDLARAAGIDLKRWYVTNSTKHGIATSRFSKSEQEAFKSHEESARFQCARVLLDEINIVKPKLIIVSGGKALASLQNAGIVNAEKLGFGHWVRISPVTVSNLPGNGQAVKLFFLYHTSARVTNQTLSRLYDESIPEKIKEIQKHLSSPDAVDQFIKNFDRPDSSGKQTVRNGMLVHLYHWLRLAETIKKLS
jgi:uracil-DNA glycosylase